MTEEEPAYLFAYGTLGPGHPLGDSAAGWCEDAVRGRLYDLGPYPALVDLDEPAAGRVEGYARPVVGCELTERLDPYEGVDEGLFRRVATTTRGGHRAWVYVYARRLPRNAWGPIKRWGRG